MLRLITQHRITALATLHTAAVALLMVNCSATGDPVSSSNGGAQSSSGGASSSSGGNAGSGTVNSYGGYLGNGGSNNASGGSTSSSNGGSSNGGSTASGGSSSASGGSTSTGSGGATSTGSGGAATTGSGGAAATTCTAYAGTVAKDSAIFVDGFGKSTTGTWSGYAFTFPYMGGGVINPDSSKGTSCFKGPKLCASGSVPASYTAGAAIGWNIGQTSGSTTKTAVALTGPVKVTAAGAAAGMRINLAPPGTAEVFCYTLLAADVASLATGLTLPLKSFEQYCYDTTKAVAYAGEMIEAIQIAVPGDMAAAKTFDFCLIDVEPG